ncbi:MAG: hypothetical protein IKD58_03970 [Loktanella sp.]|nr:hypothetical protein [Loktanella sp.]
MRIKYIYIISLAASFLPAQVLAQEGVVQKAVNPAEHTSNHPYDILGLKPGGTYEELGAVASERGIPVVEQEGTYSLSIGGAQFAMDFAYAFNTAGLENIYSYRNRPEWEGISGSLASPAAGSVITRINRTLGIPLNQNVTSDSVLAQLTEKYGPPGYVEDYGSAYIWAHDGDGNLVTEAGTCTFPERIFAYMSLEQMESENFCSVVFTFSTMTHSAAREFRFSITDIDLYMADVKAASEQIDAFFETPTSPSKLDL